MPNKESLWKELAARPKNYKGTHNNLVVIGSANTLSMFLYELVKALPRVPAEDWSIERIR